MKSNKKRRKEIKEKRIAKAKKPKLLDTTKRVSKRPLGSVESNLDELGHNNTYGLLPLYYVDLPYICRDCGSEEVWTAKQQKWWYEEIKADINSYAVRCFACRKKIRDEKAEQKRHMEEMASRNPHPNEVFFKNSVKKLKGVGDKQ
ncbi:MAG: zinc-ribbon domain-containing protein [Candidatus Thiodiazotropha sp. (ex Semelilucina semeliformis)]|nr:zinc-ribbon domain-containing protein [Candidatus Thiodiazotropha sp. (ex Semelilucina semeliformis)]